MGPHLGPIPEAGSLEVEEESEEVAERGGGGLFV
jgi:hypothetical protein